MRKPSLWILTASLLSLTFGLLPLNKIYAQPVEPAPLANAYDVIAEVNALRAANRLPAYTTNSILMQIAQAQADYLAATGGIYGHTGPGGTSPIERALAAGYSASSFSENWDANPGLSPSGAVSDWQGDSGHIYTMLSPALQDAGAGVAEVDGLIYYVLDAGRPSGSPINTLPPSGSATVIPVTPGTPATANFVKPVITSTPLPNGSIYHEVQAGQALWSIAQTYNTTIDEIKRLNNLTSNDIYIGQKLLIRRETPPTETPPAPTMTVTLGVLISTSTHPVTPAGTSTSTPVPAAPATPQTGGIVVGIIIIIALLAAGLGTWLGTKKPV